MHHTYSISLNGMENNNTTSMELLSIFFLKKISKMTKIKLQRKDIYLQKKQPSNTFTPRVEWSSMRQHREFKRVNLFAHFQRGRGVTMTSKNKICFGNLFISSYQLTRRHIKGQFYLSRPNVNDKLHRIPQWDWGSHEVSDLWNALVTREDIKPNKDVR